MSSYLFQFRRLFDDLRKGKSIQPALLLADWAESNRSILEPYRKFQQLNWSGNSYRVEVDELRSLHALSRVCDTTLFSFQSGPKFINLSQLEFVEFWQKLGIEASEPRAYHPFWCEIVVCNNVEDDDAPPQIESVMWPALTWGDLLICRADTRITAGASWMNGCLATTSPLYFAAQRGYHESHDLSEGLGSSLGWDVTFRRDYVWNRHYIFNADGASDGDEPFLQNLTAHEWMELAMKDNAHSFFAAVSRYNFGLTMAEREELLVNRCWVGTEISAEEFLPSNDTAVWKRSAPLRMF